MNNIESPYKKLLAIVDDLQSELIEYKKGSKVSDYVVKKRSELIIELIKVLELIMFYDTNEVVNTIANSIDEIKKKDNELDSLLIRVDYVPNGQKTGFIKIQAHK